MAFRRCNSIVSGPILARSPKVILRLVLAATALSTVPALRAEAAVYVVTNGNNSGGGSLRSAIQSANANAGADQIHFNAPANALQGGILYISPTSPLPTLTNAGTQILGNTQTAFGGDTNIQGPEIRLDGWMAGALADGVRITAANCVVRELTISRFAASGVRIAGDNATGAIVRGCYLGTNGFGLTAAGNEDGVTILNSADGALIGGFTPAEGNVISGNDRYGVEIRDAGTEDAIVQNNRIGVDRTGAGALANGDAGIRIWGNPLDSQISGNTISGNAGNGVEIAWPWTMGHSLRRNHIGVNQSGTAAIPNGLNGVFVNGGAQLNVIGGSLLEDANVISGNTLFGIELSDCEEISVRGNFIGTDAAGTASLGNGEGGVLIHDGAMGHQIGGNAGVPGLTAANSKNVLSGNSDGPGVLIEGDETNSNSVRSNYIGLNVNGDSPLSNGEGVVLRGGTYWNTVGGSSTGDRNIISGHGGIYSSGVRVSDRYTSYNTVAGNYIGTNAAGTAAIGNGLAGVRIHDAEYTTVGGDTAIEGNVISGNNLGVWVAGQYATNNTISGNTVGANPARNAGVDNLSSGILVNGSSTYSTVSDNYVAWNGADGIRVHAPTAGNALRRNRCWSNDGLGINLSVAGEAAFTPTLPGAPFAAANRPSISTVSVANGQTTITGTLLGTPGHFYQIELFRSPNADPSGYGEGRTYVTVLTMQVNPQGFGGFQFTLNSAYPNDHFTTTATWVTTGGTSEFSNTKKAPAVVGGG